MLISMLAATVAFFALCAAFLIGFNIGRKITEKPNAEPTDDQKKAIEKARREQHNFMTYDGTPQ